MEGAPGFTLSGAVASRISRRAGPGQPAALCRLRRCGAGLGRGTFAPSRSRKSPEPALRAAPTCRAKLYACSSFRPLRAGVAARAIDLGDPGMSGNCAGTRCARHGCELPGRVDRGPRSVAGRGCPVLIGSVPSSPSVRVARGARSSLIFMRIFCQVSASDGSLARCAFCAASSSARFAMGAGRAHGHACTMSWVFIIGLSSSSFREQCITGCAIQEPPERAGQKRLNPPPRSAAFHRARSSGRPPGPCRRIATGWLGPAALRSRPRPGTRPRRSTSSTAATRQPTQVWTGERRRRGVIGVPRLAQAKARPARRSRRGMDQQFARAGEVEARPPRTPARCRCAARPPLNP